MKIGISATGKDLDSLLIPVSGDVLTFMVDADTEEFEAISNPGSLQEGEDQAIRNY